MPQTMPRSLSLHVWPMLAGVLLAVGTTVPSHAAAQAQPPGVSLSTRYVAGQKTALIVLPVKGVNGDSVATILARDFDYSDRFNVVSTSSAPVVNGPPNYPLFSKLGVDGIVQPTLLPSGWVRVALHDVSKTAVLNSKDFPLPSPALSPAWRSANPAELARFYRWRAAMPMAPPDMPSPVMAVMIGTGAPRKAAVARAMASAWPRASPSTPG